MDRGEITAAVGISRKWEAEEAGKEVVADLSRKLGGKKPDIVLLFSTIHYKNHGGFEKLLKTINEELPKNTPIIGGTVAGFVIPDGCFTHGIAAFGIKSEQMDFSIATAKNIKRNPEGAARECAKKIRNDLSASKFKNKFLLNLPSGTTTPRIPGVPENIRVIRSKILSRLLLLGTRLSLLILQKGPGREEGIIETLAKELPEYNMIGGSFIDDNKGYFNFQFHNEEVSTNTLITLGISTNYNVDVNSNFGLKERGEKFKITKTSMYGLVIEKINGKDAFDEILTVLKWPAYFLDDSARILRRTFYAPIGYMVNGRRFTSTMAFIFGEGVVISPKVRSEDACIMTASGKDLVNVVDQNLKNTKGKEMEFGLITACIVRLETLGAATYRIHEKLVKHFGKKPFIEIYMVGEDVYTPQLGAKRITTSHNTAIFYK